MAAVQEQSESQPKVRYDDDAVKCAICHQTYTEPKCLPPPCTHVYCKTCIIKQLRNNQLSDDVTQLSFRCPTCKHCFLMQAEEVVQLEDDTFLLNLLQSSTNENNEPNHKCNTGIKFVDEVPQTDCTSCDSGISAVAVCTECKATFCESCLSAHNNFKCFRSHHINRYAMTSSVEDEDDESSRCTQHNTIRLSHYCSTCDVVVCSECISTNHESHFCVNLVQAAQVLSDKYGKLNTRRDELVKTCTDIIQHGTETYEQAVDKVRDVMIEIVNQTAQYLKTEALSAAFGQVEIDALQLCKTGDNTINHKSDLDVVKHRINQLGELKANCQRLETLTSSARTNGTSILSEFVATNQHQKCALYDTNGHKFAMSSLRRGAGDEDDVSDIDKQVVCLGSIAMLGLQHLPFLLNKTENEGPTIEKLFDVKVADGRLKGLCSNANGGLTVFDMKKNELLIFDKSLLGFQVVSCHDISSYVAMFCVEKYAVIASREKFYVYSSKGYQNCITKPLKSRYATQLAMVVTEYDADDKELEVSEVYSKLDALINEVSVNAYLSYCQSQPATITKYASIRTRRVLEFQRTTTKSSAVVFESGVGNSYVPCVDNKLMITYTAKGNEYAVLINDSYAKREVIKLTYGGSKIYHCPLPTDATFSFLPFGMCIDDEGRVLIGDAGARTVHVISKNGDVIGQARFDDMMEEGDTPSLMAYHGGGTLSLATEDGKIWIVQLRMHQLQLQEKTNKS